MRSLASNGARRCPQCRLPSRWCICSASRAIDVSLRIDLLMHNRERYRPSSTGHLIHRVFPGSTLHFWHAEQPFDVGAIERSRPEFWILHPHGDPISAKIAPDRLQVLMLDGSWSEASTMSRTVSNLGRLVSLPMSGESRYWLRDQQEGGRFSTVEALMFLLQSLDLRAAYEALRLQFELHVYANLRARGRKEHAASFLKDSPLMNALPEMLGQLNLRRPRTN